MTLEQVQYTFDAEGAAAEGWTVQTAIIEEGLSELYTAHITLLLTSSVPDDLLGASCTLHIARGDQKPQSCSGIIFGVSLTQSALGQQLLSLRVGPALMALTQRVDARTFHAISAPELITEVVDRVLEGYQRTAVQRLTKTYPPRDFCMQYNETDWDFLTRLLHEEGISFYFDHPQGSAERVTFCDDNASYPPCETPQNGQLAYGKDDTAPVEHITGWTSGQQVYSTGATVVDYDWSRPRGERVHAQQGADAQGRERITYRHRASGLHAYNGTAYQADAGTHRVSVEAQRQAMQAVRGIRGASNATTLRAGTVVEVVHHPEHAVNQRYVITHVRHEGRGREGEAHAAASERAYSNTFTCVPFSVPCQPTHAVAPVTLPGVQTAVVVGPEGEDIWTDTHGRVQIKFPWDRRKETHKDGGCWVRVMQAWAGSAFGAFTLPRVGMEVLVAFVDGEAQRPMVLGCAYHGAHAAPYALPEKKSRMVLRTRSTPGSATDAYNELSFEDAAGEEEVFMQAQRDLRITVKKDHATTVGGDAHTSVTGKDHVTVQGDASRQLGAEHSVQVAGNETLSIEGARTLQVAKNCHADVGGDLIGYVAGETTLDVDHSYAMTVSKDASVNVEGAMRTVVGQSSTLSANKDVQVTAKEKIVQQAEAMALAATKSYTLQQGEAKIALKNGEVHITGKRVIINGKTITIEASGALTTRGKTVGIN